MCVSNKRFKCELNSVSIDGNLVDVVDSFKLLGVHIDSKLNFESHTT